MNAYQLSAKCCIKYSQLQNPSLLASEKIKGVAALCWMHVTVKWNWAYYWSTQDLHLILTWRKFGFVALGKRVPELSFKELGKMMWYKDGIERLSSGGKNYLSWSRGKKYSVACSVVWDRNKKTRDDTGERLWYARGDSYVMLGYLDRVLQIFSYWSILSRKTVSSDYYFRKIISTPVWAILILELRKLLKKVVEVT